MRDARRCQCGYENSDGARTCQVCGAALRSEQPQVRRSPNALGRAAPDRQHMLVSAGADPQVLTPGKTFAIGRADESDLTVPSKRVSRQHAEVFWRAGFPVLRNLSEHNPTLVNGRPVEEHELRERDEVQIGPFLCSYRCVRGDVDAALEGADTSAATLVAGGAALEGKLEEMGLEELLRSFEQQKRSGTLDLRAEAGEGRVVLDNGRCASATASSLSGQEALFALLEWREGTFAFNPGAGGAAPMKIVRSFDLGVSGGPSGGDLKRTPISRLLQMAERRRKRR